MKTLIILSLLTLASLQSRASGGMIGGGEVNFKSVLSCDAQSIDPTFPEFTKVTVVKEVDHNNNFIENATLRVMTSDGADTPRHFFVTHATHLRASEGLIHLPIWHDQGSGSSTMIGALQLNTQTRFGELRITEGDLRIETTLTNCH